VKDELGKPYPETTFRHWRPPGAHQWEDRFSDGTVRLVGFLCAILDGQGTVLLRPALPRKRTQSREKKGPILWEAISEDFSHGMSELVEPQALRGNRTGDSGRADGRPISGIGPLKCRSILSRSRKHDQFPGSKPAPVDLLESDSGFRYRNDLSRHGRTLSAMRRRPRPSNLRWADVESLLVHLGGVVRQGKGSAISVTLGGKTAYFHPPHPGDKARRWAIETALRLLEEAHVDLQSL